MTEPTVWTLATGLAQFCQGFLGDATGQLAQALSPLARLQPVAKHEVVFCEGEQGQRMYFVLTGVVKLSKLGSKGNEVTVFLAQQGDVFAEILSHLNYRYPVTATALEPTTLLSLDVKTLEQHLAHHPELAGRFITALAQRIKHLLKTVERLTIEDLRERFLSFVDGHLAEHGQREYRWPVTKKEMAQLMGVTPETFSRLLKQLEQTGDITLTPAGIARP